MVILGYLTMAIVLSFKKKLFPVKSYYDYEINSSAPSVSFKIELIKDITIICISTIVLPSCSKRKARKKAR